MQHSGTNLIATSSHLRTIHASAPVSTRLGLPSRNVTAGTIEEAFVQFILSCNPGIPLVTDTAALKEAFRTPPKSEGKSFSTWTLFELISQFQSKEIKTWGDLALKLGVEPPDQDKGQSSQKIQQYAVRLKRWMHSMHVDAFFEYLLDNPHPYWTEIPLDPNPITEGGRDGVAAEDDMALRSLLPHIKPRRGRKRPDDESVSSSPSQRPKMEPGSDQNNPNVPEAGVDQQQLDLWAAAQPNARNGAYLFAQDQFTRMNMNSSTSGPGTGKDFAQTSMTAQPYSAVTPATAGGYWSEQTDGSKIGITPMKSKTNRRHGAKVVSSAWRSGGPGGSGKIRGRPPLNRQTSQTHSQGEVAAAPSFSSFPSAESVSPPAAFIHPSLHQSPQGMEAALQQHPMMTPGMNNPAAAMSSTPNPQQGMGSMQQGYNATGQSHAESQSRSLRPKRSRLSLQVPERTSAEVRLATPNQAQQQMPGVMVNGAMTTAGDQVSIMAHHQHHQSLNASMEGSDVHMMDPFASVATQDMYNMLYQQQQAQQHHHQQQQHQDPRGIQHVPQSSQATVPLYSTTNQPPSLPPTTLFHEAPPASHGKGASSADTQPTGVPFPDASNRTNLEALEALLTYELLGAEWADAQGTRIATCGVDEAEAVAREIVENARRVAGSAQGFLMNVAAIAGVTWLKRAEGRVSVQRMGTAVEEGGGVGGGGRGRREVYDVHWELQLGDVRSGFSLREVVGREGWEKPRGWQGEEVAEDEEDDEAEEEEDNAAKWRKRYHELLGVVQEQNAELSGLRQGVIDLCRPRGTKREGGGDESTG